MSATATITTSLSEANPERAVESYLDEIAMRVWGPAAVKRQIILELRDGLLETIEANCRSGMVPAEAVAAAIRMFGDPPSIAGAFASELAAVHARRFTTRLLSTGPLVGAVWTAALLASDNPIATAYQGGGGIWILFPVIGFAIVLTVIASFAAIVGTGRLGQRLPILERSMLRAAALAGAGVIFVDVAMTILVGVQLVVAPAILAPIPITIAIATSLLRLRLAAPSAHRCIAAAAHGN